MVIHLPLIKDGRLLAKLVKKEDALVENKYICIKEKEIAVLQSEVKTLFKEKIIIRKKCRKSCKTK